VSLRAIHPAVAALRQLSRRGNVSFTIPPCEVR
jgi:hypothetical protein